MTVVVLAFFFSEVDNDSDDNCAVIVQGIWTECAIFYDQNITKINNFYI